jgi:TP901 family phage tail tape measure protein
VAAQVVLNVQLNENNALTTMQSIDKYAQKLNGMTIKLNIDTKGLDGLSNKMLTVINNQAKAEISANKLAAAQANCSAQTTKSATQQARLAVEQTKANTAQTRAETAANKQAAALDKTTKSASLLGDSLGNVVLKMAAWQLIGNAIASVKNAFNDALTEMKAVDSELVTVRKVTGATAEELKGLEQRAYKVGSAYGVAASDYLSAVAEFSRAGYKDLAADLGELAVKTQLVGDVDQATANQFLLSVDAAYKYGGSVAELSKVLDGANEIDNNYATSIQKIAEGLGKVSPIAAQAHVSIGELSAGIGTITAVTQRSGSEAATALRALFLNIMGDTKTEIADGATWTAGEIENLRDVIKLYAKDAYDAAEATGSVINPMEAIAGLAQSMKDGLLTEQQLVEMVSDIGGKLRSSQLLALIQNWDMYKNMLADFGDSVGSADKEIENALDSWDRKTKILSNTWTEFIQKSISTDMFKGIIDGTTGAIKLLGDFQSALTIALSILAAFKANDVLSWFKELDISLRTIKTGFANMAKSASLANIAVAGIAVAITGLVVIGNAIRNNRNELISMGEAARNAAGDLSKLNDQELERLEIKADAALKAAEANLLTNTGKNSTIVRQFANEIGANQNTVEGLIETYNALVKKQEEMYEQGLQDTYQYQTLSKVINDLSSDVDAYTLSQKILSDIQNKVSDETSDLSGEAKTLSEELERLGKQGKLTSEYVEQLAKEYPELQKYMDENNLTSQDIADSYNKLAKSADEAKSAVEKFNEVLKGEEKSEVYDQYVDAFKRVKEAAEAGLWGSTAFQEGIKLFANPETIKQFGDDYKGLWDYMTSHGLGEVFGDADSNATAFLTK